MLKEQKINKSFAYAKSNGGGAGLFRIDCDPQWSKGGSKKLQ